MADNEQHMDLKQDVIVVTPDSPILVPDLNEPVDVQVFIPMNNGEHLHMVLDEIQENELMGGEYDHEVHNHEESTQLIQLGFVELQEHHTDPVMGAFMPNKALPANSYGIWVKHFAPGANNLDVSVPPEWTAFFTATLMNLASFAWAKKFLSSSAWFFLCN